MDITAVVCYLDSVLYSRIACGMEFIRVLPASGTHEPRWNTFGVNTVDLCSREAAAYNEHVVLLMPHKRQWRGCPSITEPIVGSCGPPAIACYVCSSVLWVSPFCRSTVFSINISWWLSRSRPRFVFANFLSIQFGIEIIICLCCLSVHVIQMAAVLLPFFLPKQITSETRYKGFLVHQGITGA